jgi:hypothetical protein
LGVFILEPIPNPSSGKEAEHFDGDFAVVFPVLSQVDRGHAADSDLPLKAVTIGQCSLQSFFCALR